MSTQLQIRGGTAAAWTAANPILAQREMGVETDTLNVKIGDGVTQWSSLPYLMAVGAVVGPTGPAVYLEADPGEQGDQGFPGAIGPMGIQGLQGIQGDQGDPGDDGVPIPGNQGPQGPQGATGATGPTGNTGPTGPTGATGAQGPMSPSDNMLWLESDRDDEGWQNVSSAGVASLLIASLTSYGSAPGNDPHLLWNEADKDVEQWPQMPSGPTSLTLDPFAGGLTASTTINDTTTYTTGGISLANQIALAGSMWRIRVTGEFVAVSSATARNAQIAAFWGATQLTGFAVAVLASNPVTSQFRCEIELTASSTTAIWATGFLLSSTGVTTGAQTQTRLTPTSNTVTAGPQTLDVRFSMSAAVATDQWIIDQVTIERLK